MVAVRRPPQAARALIAVRDDIAGIVSTIPDLYSSKPVVEFNDPEAAPDHPELIRITQRNRSEMTWERMPAGRDEVIEVAILVHTGWEGRTGEEVLDRLIVIVDLVCNIWHNTTTDPPVYTPPTTADGYTFERTGDGNGSGVVSTVNQVYPHSSGVGMAGTSTINLRLVARI